MGLLREFLSKPPLYSSVIIVFSKLSFNLDCLCFSDSFGYKRVDIEIFKIHDNNILQFLQVNEIDQNGELERVGNVIYRKKLALK